VMLRVFAVSGYRWDTAFVVSTTLTVTNGLTMLLGSLLAEHLLTAALVGCLMPLLVADYLWGDGRRRTSVLLVAALALATSLAVVLSFGLWWLPLAAVAVFGVLAMVRRSPPQSFLRRLLVALLARVSVVAGVGVLLIAAFGQTPWVPLERIQTTSGTVDGYVLSVDPGYLNVLTTDHRVEILISADVVSRS
jgi:O-antigen ligase